MTATPAPVLPLPAVRFAHSGSQRGSGARSLWVAVVTQAAEDATEALIDGLIFGEAVAFFIGRGVWLDSRAAVADQLEVHADDLERYGRRIINARLLAEGRPPLAPKFMPPKARPAKLRQAPPPPPPPPLPKLVATFVPEPEPERRRGGWTKRWPHNPFDPSRIPAELPSETRAKAKAA